MSDVHPLRARILDEFTKAFGPRTTREGNDAHWSLRAFQYVAAVNILVNGSSNHPVVWIFDPHDALDGIHSESMEHESQIAPLIAMIVEKVQAAGRPRKS